MSANAIDGDVDRVIEVYKRDVDRTLLERNLRLTPSQRLEQLQRAAAAIHEMRQAVRRLGDASRPH